MIFTDSTSRVLFFFFFKGSGAHRDLPSSPPRRSPDLIRVGGGKEDEDAPASGNLDVAGAVGLLRGAKEALDRRFEAQRLVDRRRHETRVRAERAPLFGVRDQGEEQVAEEVRRGLVPGQEKQEEEPENLRLGERPFLVGWEHLAA